MLHTVVIVLGLVVSSPVEPAGTTASDLKTYEAVEPRQAATLAHVRLALWCEAHGLAAERVRQLLRAIAIDPNQVTARGLLGLIDSGGQWLRPEEVGQRRKSDQSLMKKMEDYHARRVALLRIAACRRRSSQSGPSTREAGNVVRTARVERPGDRPLDHGDSARPLP